MKLFTRLTFFLLSFTFFLNFSTLSFAQTINRPATHSTNQPQRIVIINQVRGGECCEPGSLATLQSFIAALKQRQLSATFTVRYDALKDEQFVTELKKLPTSQLVNKPINQPSYELGLFLEITPTLANESGVEYKGSAANWYQAQYAYLIGYEPNDRKKIIDRIFGTFKQQFGYYPTTTTAWMIDTDSLNYVKEKYGSAVHQITREQWGTDSYTLSGGPVHYPYLADKSWAFLPMNQPASQPSNEATDQLTTKSTLIVRQTISDPLRNYGDATSAFTSQPNDYLIDRKTTDYFKKLLLQSLDQPANQYGFALIGLENSMREEVNTEFQNQLEFVENLTKERAHLRVQTAAQFNEEYRQKWQSQAITSITGKDLIGDSSHQTIWINTPQYRARILRKDNTVAMTDFRLYQPNNEATTQSINESSRQLTTQPVNQETDQPTNSLLSDPYNQIVAHTHGYWVTPFVIDGSRFYQLNQTQPLSPLQRMKEAVKASVLPEYTYREQVVLPSQNELTTQPMSLQLPEITTGTLSLERVSEEELRMHYSTVNNEPVTLTFSPTDMRLNSARLRPQVQLQTFSELTPFLKLQQSKTTQTIQWVSQENMSVMELKVDCPTDDECQLTPHLSGQLNWNALRKQFYPFLFPDLSLQQFSAQSSVVYAHNRVAIAGQNPIRLVFLPRDENGYPVKRPEQIELNSSPELSEVLIQNQHGQLGTSYIDLIENRAGKYQVTLTADGQPLTTTTVLFIPDCKTQLKRCLTQPRFLSGYIEYQFITRLRQL